VTPAAARSSATSNQILIPVQALRALAALAVVALHVQMEAGRPPSIPPALPDMRVGNAGVDLFFVISGFVMVYSSEALFGRGDGPWRFFVRRLIRIVPLYWLVTTYYVLRHAFFPSGEPQKPIEFIVSSYLFIPYPLDGHILTPMAANQPFLGLGWTLNYEMLFYLLFSIPVLLSRRAAVLVTSIVLITFVIAGIIAPGMPFPWRFWADPIVLEFVFGMSLGLVFREGWRLPRWLCWTLLVAGLLAFNLDPDGTGSDYRAAVWGIPAAMMVAGATLGDFKPTGRVWRWIAIVGDASYALYLTHFLPIRAMVHLSWWTHFDMASAPWLWMAATLLVAIATSVVIFYAVERPINFFLRRLSAVGPAKFADGTVRAPFSH